MNSRKALGSNAHPVAIAIVIETEIFSISGTIDPTLIYSIVISISVYRSYHCRRTQILQLVLRANDIPLYFFGNNEGERVKKTALPGMLEVCYPEAIARP